MIRKINFLYILILLQLSISSIVFGQGHNYPIYVTPTLVPPYSLSLADFGASGSNKIMVNVVVNDINISNLPVKFRFKIDGPGITIENAPTVNTLPIFLDGGTTNIFMGDDFSHNFNLNNLIFKGIDQNSYQRSGQLPEGLYTFSVEILHFHTNRVISNVGRFTTWIAIGKPPILRMPANNSTLGLIDGTPLTFSWTTPNIGRPVMKKFELWEMRHKGFQPNAIVVSTPTIHEHSTSEEFYVLNPALLNLEPGIDYVWRVTAYDPAGLLPFEQNGESEVRVFTYKSTCETPENVTAQNAGKRGIFNWDFEQNNTSFNVEVKDDKGWSLNAELFNNQVVYNSLEPGSVYNLRVQAVCNNDPTSASDFSEWVTLRIPTEEERVANEDCPECSCDTKLDLREITNFEEREVLNKGDILTNRTGGTQFIIEEATQQPDGSFSGLFYFWMKIWNAKIPCTFEKLRVNTDNVILTYRYESINDPQFLVNLEKAKDSVNEFVDNVVVAFTSTTIQDTITITEKFDNIIVRDNKLIAITYDEEGNVSETDININVSDAQKTIIANSSGDSLVITNKKEAMGIKEYTETGGNSRLIKNHNQEKEKSLSNSMTTFSRFNTQQYGFDSYEELKQAISNEYPTLDNGYRTPFKSIESYRYDRVNVDNPDGFSFRTEMGIPLTPQQGTLSFMGSSGGSTTALYAYQTDQEGNEQVAGKLNVVSFDKIINKVHIIPVNNAKISNEKELERRLNEIYGQAVATWKVIKEPNLTVNFPNGNMLHGSMSAFSVYNADHKLIATTYENSNRQMEKGEYYLFYIDGVTFKERSLAGYMPLGYQAGYIYENPRIEIVAHELGHGAFSLRHTFSPDQFIANEGKTQNLMDYAGGTELWHHQWQEIHNPNKLLFGWAQDEEEGEMKSGDDLIIDVLGKIRCAIASNRTKVFIGSNSRFVFGKNKSPEFYVELYLADYKSKYDYYDLNISYKKLEYNALKYKYDFGNDLYIIVRKEMSDIFETYLNNSDFNSEYKKISQLIANDKASKAIDELYNFSYCVFEKLSTMERSKLLSAFAEKIFLPENYEDMVLNLLRSLNTSGEKERAKDLLYIIFNKRVKRSIIGQITEQREKTLFEVLTSGMNDFSGKANYSEWIMELTNLFIIAYGEELEKGKYPDGQFIFPNSIAISSTTPYHFYNWNYKGGSDVSLYNDKYRLNLISGIKEVQPTDIINVRFSRDFEFIPNGTQPTIAMPAFCLVYLLNHEQVKLKMNVAKYIINVVGIYNTGQRLIVTKGSKLLASLVFLKEVADPIFSNKDFQDWAIKTLKVPEDFFVSWEYINAFDITRANANSIIGLMTKRNWFEVFYENWQLMIDNKLLVNEITQSKVNELGKTIEGIKNYLENENVIY